MLKAAFLRWRPCSFLRCYTKQVLANEMKYLNVAEKNDAAKTIAGLLSRGAALRREGYSVYNKIYDFEAVVQGQNSKMVMTSVSGHLLELDFVGGYRRWQSVDPQSLFTAPVRKTCGESYAGIKRTLEREVRGCQALIIWTDCDREGENIGFEVIEVCRAVKPNIKVYRATFSEITTAAVQRALQRLSNPDKRLSDAVDVRTELDLRTGAAITRFQTMRLQRLFPTKLADKMISYGSCQIPTLGFVAERYKEIEAFVSELFWKLKVAHTIEDLTVEFNWARNRLFDKTACEDFLLLCLADPKATVEEVSVKPKNKWRPMPMDTVEMEKLGSRKLKLSAKETMSIAEKLYTRGIISYPRTETNQFSKEIDLRSLVEHQSGHSSWGSFAQRVLEWGPNPRNGNKSDQAHPPIHPTKLVTDLEGNEARVYELICRHFLACVSKDAVGSETVVRINIAGEKFTATGLCIYERNYLDVYIYDKWNAKQIHKYEQGQVFEPTEISMQEGATTAPPLLTEADLIALMEKHGIGTDATHAEHINTIKERGYIGVVDKGCLIPGVIGMGLYEGYEAMELTLAKPQLRAEFESDLKKICLGEKDPQTVLRDQIEKYKAAYRQITDKITAMDDKLAQRLNVTPSSSEASNAGNSENGSGHLQELFQCPKCLVAALALRKKRNQSGFYIGCINFPDCKNAIWLPDECKEPTVLNESCRHCGSGVKLLKFKFISVSFRNYFNAPHGWYKTCLQCDTRFRETFDINIDKVKRAGTIVNAAPNSTSSIKLNRPEGTTNNAPTTVIDNGGRHPTNPSRGPSKPGEKQKKSVVKTNQQTIRKFYTTTITNATQSANNRTVAPSSLSILTAEDGLVAAQLEDIPMDEFFDSNDGFDDIIRSIEATPTNVASTTKKGSTTAPQTSVDRTYPRSANVTFDDSFTALLSEAGNELGDDYVWGTVAHSRRSAEGLNTAPSVAKRPCLQQAVVNHDWSKSTTTRPSGPKVKCTGCHEEAKELRVKKDGPNKGRTFYVCPKKKECSFFQWADLSDGAVAGDGKTTTDTPTTARYVSSWDSTTNARAANDNSWTISPTWGSGGNTAPGDSDIVKCNCNIPLSRLTVRKEGPNKGRHFYACSNREKSCNFFKWEDDDNQASTSWGARKAQANTTREISSSSSKTSQNDRKCRLCRQVGHTKNKCPRKDQFTF